MPKQVIENLISQLHETFGDEETSAQQAQLMQDMENHVHNWDEPEPSDPSFSDTAAFLLEELEEENPKAAAIVKQIIQTLDNIGI